MNYAEARQRSDKEGKPLGLWDWTNMRDKKVWRIAPCTADCQHNTPEEACRHFYDYCLDQARAHTLKDQQLKCAICEEWTQILYGNDQMWLALRPVPLCEKHANKEGLEKACPFGGSIQLMHS